MEHSRTQVELLIKGKITIETKESIEVILYP